jgi:hypothetical protein
MRAHEERSTFIFLRLRGAQPLLSLPPRDYYTQHGCWLVGGYGGVRKSGVNKGKILNSEGWLGTILLEKRGHFRQDIYTRYRLSLLFPRRSILTFLSLVPDMQCAALLQQPTGTGEKPSRQRSLSSLTLASTRHSWHSETGQIILQSRDLLHWELRLTSNAFAPMASFPQVSTSITCCL